MAGYYRLSQSKNGSHFFVLQAENGQTVLTSQMYTTRQGALAGIESVRQNAADDARYERKQAASGKAFFVLKAANTQVVGTSQQYATTRTMEGGITSVKRLARTATLKDE